MPLRAITFDYWDTLYVGTPPPARKDRARAILRELLRRLGHELDPETFEALYHASAKEADRWWREEHRGYTADERIRWMLRQLAIERPATCEHVSWAVREIDATMVAEPPPLIPGVAEGLRALAREFDLAIISDTGFASGEAQNEVLARDGLRDVFRATIYSMDIGHAKPRPEPFVAALTTLGIDPAEALHVGDNERTDVGGALGVGMRAVRVDIVRQNGESKAELVARRFDDLVRYLRRAA